MSRSIPSHNLLKFTAIPLALGILSACGGGGGGSVGIADGGIRGTGSSVGPVSGFGSVFVNGVKFETDGIVNGEVQGNDGIFCEQNCTQPLEKGMILRVEGQWDGSGSGTAESLEYDDTFRGTVTEASVTQTDAAGFPQAGTITVLGQTISFDRRTVIQLTNGFTDGSDLEGAQVRISAWSSVGGYRASYIGELDNLPNNWVELEGSATYESSGVLFIGDQRIVVPNEVFLEGVTADGLADENQRIEVEGEFNGISVTARTIRPADDRRYTGQDGEDIEITGTVSDYSPSANGFSVNGAAVTVTSDTEFDDLDRSELEDGMLVRVEGDFRNGAIVAEEIELFEGNAEVEATVIGKSDLPNSWNIGGVTVVFTNSTVIEFDDGVSDISAGLAAEVEGIERTGAGDRVYLEALAVEIENDASSEFELVGRLDRANTTSVSIRVLGLDLINYSGTVPSCNVVEVEYASNGGGGYIVEDIECEDDN